MNLLKAVLMCLMPMAAMATFGVFDVVVNADKIKYAPDMSEVRLVDPKITLKHPHGKPVTKAVSAQKLASFWDAKNRQDDYFADVKPNARLTAWDQHGLIIQSDFVVTNARHDHDDLILAIAPLDKHLVKLPIDKSDIRATMSHFRHVTGKAEKAAVTVLIDCNCGDPRC